MTREEAIDKLKRLCSPEQMTALRVLVPELQESEDERHIKWILEYLYDGLRKADEQFKDHFKSAIDWLEKQKAKERLDRMAPIYNNKESFESALEKAWKYYNESASRTVDSFEDNYIECVFSKGFREGFLYKEKQKEQKPVEYLNKDKVYSIITKLVNLLYSPLIPINSDEYKRLDEITSEVRSLLEQKPIDKADEDVELTPFESALFSAFSDAWQEYMRGEAVNVAHWAKKHSGELLEVVKEDSEKWSEADAKLLDKCKYFIAIAPVGWNMEEGQKAYDCGQWLKSLPSRFNLQPTKQEWSSEDERMLNVAIRSCEQTIEDYPNERVRFKDCISWLKSIRPQPHWKPSEEQPQVADASKMDSLEYWLRKFGMPEENIENCITQIAQGYGACRYLEGIQLGAEAVNELVRQEQPDVDLEKELDQWRHDHFKGKRDGDYSGEYLERESQLDLARHFYELGLNTRKEENK